MNVQKIRRITGALLITGAVLVNIPYTFLIMNFDYPDILREPTGEILTRFAAGGPGLVWTWLAFAWVGLPILLGILFLPQALDDNEPEDRPYNLGRVAMYFGAAGAVAQIIGLLRWPLVVSDVATREGYVSCARPLILYGQTVIHRPANCEGDGQGTRIEVRRI